MSMKIWRAIECLVTVTAHVWFDLNTFLIVHFLKNKQVRVHHVLTVVWVNLCRVRLPGWRKARPQWSHLNGFSPVWMRWNMSFFNIQEGSLKLINSQMNTHCCIYTLCNKSSQACTSRSISMKAQLIRKLCEYTNTTLASLAYLHSIWKKSAEIGRDTLHIMHHANLYVSTWSNASLHTNGHGVIMRSILITQHGDGVQFPVVAVNSTTWPIQCKRFERDD